MLHSEVVDGPVHELERGQNLGQLALRFLVKRQDVLKLRQGEHDVVGRLRRWCRKDRNTSDDTESAFCADEQLL